MKQTFLFICLMFSITSLFSQKQLKDADYKKHPYWIEMIKDPNVNYFEAIKAYELFWEGKEIPHEEDEKIGQKTTADEKEHRGEERRERREKKREREFQQKYGLDCKKFEHWKMMVKPYVQEDGRILSKEEQLKIWEEQRQK